MGTQAVGMNEDRTEEAPTSPPRSHAPSSAKGGIIVEDRTDPDTKAALEEVKVLRMWIASQRAQGFAPN